MLVTKSYEKRQMGLLSYSFNSGDLKWVPSASGAPDCSLSLESLILLLFCRSLLSLFSPLARLSSAVCSHSARRPAHLQLLVFLLFPEKGGAQAMKRGAGRFFFLTYGCEPYWRTQPRTSSLLSPKRREMPLFSFAVSFAQMLWHPSPAVANI